MITFTFIGLSCDGWVSFVICVGFEPKQQVEGHTSTVIGRT